MANYRIICTRKQDVLHPYRHGHLVQVGTGATPRNYDKLWTIAEVYQAMNAGDIFYTQSESTGRTASVHPYQCGACQAPTLRTSPDAVHDNNLDNLPNCN